MSVAVSTENSDVRCAQRGRVVDSIAHEPDDVALARRTRMTRSLCAGERRRTARPISGLGQFGVGHFLDVTAQQHGIGREAHVSANLAAYQSVIPVRIFTATPSLCSAARARAAVSLGGPGMDVPSEDKITLVFFRADLLACDFFRRDSQHPEAIVAQVVILLLQAGGMFGSIVDNLPASSNWAQWRKTSSGAPLVSRIEFLRGPGPKLTSCAG